MVYFDGRSMNLSFRKNSPFFQKAAGPDADLTLRTYLYVTKLIDRSSPNERMEPENRRNLTMENLTRRNARGQRSGVIEPTQNCLFYRGIKEDG
jgi:hypothetical protein